MRITRATHKAAEYACKNFHYAHRLPIVHFAYNIYNNSDEWCGVIIYGSGAIPQIAMPFDLAQGEVLELVRVALNGKQEATSQAVALSLKQLHRDAPQVKIVVSYADIDQQHAGIIYQATNWLYLGIVNEGSKGLAYIVNGQKVHTRSLYKICPPPAKFGEYSEIC